MQSPPFNKTGSPAMVRILRLSRELRRHAVLGYAMAFVVIGLASLLEWLARDQYAGAPFLTIYPGVIVAALIGGRGPGFLAATLAGGTQFALFIPAPHWLAVASYALDATVCVMLIDYINQTLDLLLANIAREQQAKQHQYILAKELHHRIQNLFTVIQGVIRFSLPVGGMVEAAALRERLIDRLQAMSAANRAITDSMGDGVRLLELVAGEIRGFESRFEITGTSGLVLGAQLTQNLSLILHELVTNALKYGALSVPQGRISLRMDWAAPVMTFDWQERGGPPATKPESAGFGSRILRTFAKSFCRQVETGYEASGLHYILQIESDQIRNVKPSPALAPPIARAPDTERATPAFEGAIEEVELNS